MKRNEIIQFLREKGNSVRTYPKGDGDILYYTHSGMSVLVVFNDDDIYMTSYTSRIHNGINLPFIEAYCYLELL